jgi:hypothetical protein
MEMKARMLSLLAAVAMFGAVSAASAAEPLTDNQLDSVAAGATAAAAAGINAVAGAAQGAAIQVVAGGNSVLTGVGSNVAAAGAL